MCLSNHFNSLLLLQKYTLSDIHHPPPIFKSSLPHVSRVSLVKAEDVILVNTSKMYHAFNLNDALDKDNPETESNSKFSKNLSQDTLEGKDKSHINFENLSFSCFLKENKI